jgi:hypothetical protein
MHGWVYQIFHPWHWLTYGQNAAGVGLIGLFSYTLYTRRMMKLGERNQRANITPILILSGQVRFTVSSMEPVPPGAGAWPLHRPTEYRAEMTIRNIGQGTAIFLQAWWQPVSAAFSISDTSLLNRTPAATEVSPSKNELLKGESAEVVVRKISAQAADAPLLFVMDTIDQANGRHQIKILFSGMKESTIAVTMAHAQGDSFGERVAAFAARLKEILNAIKRIVLSSE